MGARTSHQNYEPLRPLGHEVRGPLSQGLDESRHRGKVSPHFLRRPERQHPFTAPEQERRILSSPLAAVKTGSGGRYGLAVARLSAPAQVPREGDRKSVV